MENPDRRRPSLPAISSHPPTSTSIAPRRQPHRRTSICPVPSAQLDAHGQGRAKNGPKDHNLSAFDVMLLLRIDYWREGVRNF